MEALTARQEAILDYIQERILERGGAPSLMEIGAQFGIPNPNGIRAHLLALEKKGYIRRTPDQARSIRLVPGPRRAGLITALKQKLWARRGYFVYLPITLVFHTRKGRPFFTGALAGELERQVRRVCAEHDWEIAQLDLRPDGFSIRLLASPDHSPERIARNLKNAALPLGARHPLRFHGRPPWAPGFVATTDPQLLDELLAHYRAAPPAADAAGKGD